ncbi:MAG: anthranilate phosphoribosyltransferase [Gluconacetobacter diazotrophicus]|nr:anthranilate phosphoribosyltransferase [Gluconacetobacter diazotrophicus]
MERGDTALSVVRDALARVASGAVLDEAAAEAVFAAVMDGQVTAAQLGALLMGLRVRGEGEGELVGAARAMRARMRRVPAPDGAVDLCGTGGDGLGTLNVSTAAAIVVAAAGVPVAKHGGRAVSSRAGAVDVLGALGIAPEEDPERLGAALRRRRIAFLAAPAHHPAMRHAAPVRAELGVRTLFNLLGPVCNPAGVRRQMVGVFAAERQEAVARVLHRLGADGAWVVHGDGLDELGLHGINRVVVMEGGGLEAFRFTATELGLEEQPVAAIAGGDAATNAAAIQRLLAGEPGAYRDTVLLNAGAALCMAAGRGISEDMVEYGTGPEAGAGIEGGTVAVPPPLDALRRGIARAAAAIDGGNAAALLRAVREDALDGGLAGR